MRKPSIKTLRKKLKALVYEYVFLRDDDTCQKTGKKVSGSNRHPAHVIPKSKGNALRWNPINILTFSFHSHINWWHQNPLEAAEWFKKKFPKRWAYLEKHKNDIVKFKRDDYLKMIEDISRKLEILKETHGVRK